MLVLIDYLPLMCVCVCIHNSFDDVSLSYTQLKRHSSWVILSVPVTFSHECIQSNHVHSPISYTSEITGSFSSFIYFLVIFYFVLMWIYFMC